MGVQYKKTTTHRCTYSDKFYLRSFLLLTLLSSPCHADNCSVLTFNGGDNQQPLFFRDSQKASGVLVDVLDKAAINQNKSLSLKPEKPWKRLLLELQHGKLDFIAGVTLSNDREKLFKFSMPIAAIRFNLYVRKNKPFQFTTLSDLSPYIGGKLLGQSLGDQVDNFAFNHLVIEEKLSLKSLFKMLEYGRLDYVVVYEQAAIQYISENELSDKVMALEKPIYETNVHIAATRHRHCSSDIDNILAEIKSLDEKGEIQLIKNSYANAVGGEI